ncbi:MAG: hypothetical protein ACMUIA_06115 [bacterium]
MSLYEKKICLADLMNALHEEIELECPSISDEEKALLAEYMAWDMLQRGDYLAVPAFSGQNPHSLFSSFSFSDVQTR